MGMPEPVLMDDAENQIKKIYIEEVNHLISYYEIYSHDIPADIVEEIVMVFQTYSQAQLSSNNDEKDKMYKFVLFKCKIICHKLRSMLIDVYWGQIKLLKKFIVQFNYKGVKLDKEDCDDNIQKCFFWIRVQDDFKKIDSEIKNLKKIERIKKKSKYDVYDCQDTIIDMTERIYSESRQLLNLYERYMPKIMNTGYNGSTLKHIITNAYIVITFILPIVTILLNK